MKNYLSVSEFDQQRNKSNSKVQRVMHMKEDYARAIELPFWQAPNDYVFVSSKRDWMCISCNI